MIQLLNVFSSDAVSRCGTKFTVGALESALSQAWLRGVPMHLSHDIHRPVGWSRPIGLYFEPRLTRLVGIGLIAETSEEQEQVNKAQEYYLAYTMKQQCAPHIDKLKSLLKKSLSGQEKFFHPECVAVVDTGITAKVFPHIFTNLDKDGLIPIKDILSHFQFLGPGVFRQGDLAIFAHYFFRRSLSRLNNFHMAFLQRIDNYSKRQDLDIKIAIDPDMVGLAATYKKPIELEYWWGPKFNENLTSIPEGVSTHGANEYQKMFYGVSRTEFRWKKENRHKIFEAEELRDIPTFAMGRDSFGCRYVHSMMEASGLIFHLDGAIRMYSRGDMASRLEKHIASAGKHTGYSKVFRIDGPLKVSEWKGFLSDYFQGNRLIGEYFGVGKERNIFPAAKRTSPTPAKERIVPYSMNSGMGVRLMISYHRLDTGCFGDEREVVAFDTITIGDKRTLIVEADVVELKKALERIGCPLKIPGELRFLAYEDLYLNLPLIRHSKNALPDNLIKTLDAIKLLVDSLKNKEADKVLSFTVSWPTETKELRLSVLGHVSDLSIWLNSNLAVPPTGTDDISGWTEKVAAFLSQKWVRSDDRPPLFETVKPTGILLIKRNILSEETAFHSYYSDEHNALMFELAIPKSDGQLAKAVKNGELSVGMSVFINEAECSKCHGDYKVCNHSKYLDDAVYQRIKKMDFAFPFWTDRKA